ncbi:MAG: glycosyltransferase [Xanthomonadales bacterium]|nr:glycosyltransferase [Xanthomonadales bacterium]
MNPLAPTDGVSQSGQPGSSNPSICRYGGHASHRQAGLPEGVDVVELTSLGPADALREAITQTGGRDFVLLHRETSLPPHWLPRLQAALAAEPSAACVSPLALGAGPLDPAPEASPEDLDAIDRRCFALAERKPTALSAWLPALSLWRAEALIASASTLTDAGLPVGAIGLLCDSLCVEAVDHSQRLLGRQINSAPIAVTAMRARLADREDAPERAGLDPRPVLLHVLHGWGGGAARFVGDLIHGDDQRVHRVLIASGRQGEGNGLRLSLQAGPDSPALRQWPLSAPIDACAIASAEYRAVLDEVIARESVAGILVSSLIGHSLDALRTGLPTAVVCHDYFPLWPLLHDAFDNADRDFSPDTIADALARASREWVFGERRAAHWQALREGWLAAVSERQLPLVAPSNSLRGNLLRIEPRLSADRLQVIEHGFAGWSSTTPDIATDTDRRALRIVVPGRINGGKGEDLLADLLPQLPADVEVILLGSGRAGMRFFGQGGVHLQMNYDHDELPALLAELRPDAALLPSTVPETWSYLLSELWSLGLPVIATRLGSFAERIEPGVDGLLVEPSAEAIARLLATLRDDRSPLSALKHRDAMRGLGDMADDYRRLLPLAPASHSPASSPSSDAVQRLEQECKLADSERTRQALADTVASQQKELDRRAGWAADLSRNLAEKTRWSEKLQDERDAVAGELRRTQVEGEAARDALESDLRDTQRDYAMLDGEYQALQARQRELQQEFDERTEWALSLDEERNRIINSTSWKLTRPLRFVRRKLGALLARLRFTQRRVDNLRHRGLRSLKTRGVRGSIERLKQEFDSQPQVAKPSVPETTPFAPFTLPTSESPVVSVVIPAYNHFDATLLCLKSIAAISEETPFEVILVDDCGSDETAEQAAQIDGLRFFRNEQNLGFIGACNRGAAEVRGEFLLFLNNDTAVQPGWIDALVATFDQHRDVGLVGSKLVYPDGRLQEAGGIVFRDASGWNYGRFDDPAKPEYNFVRDVDYVSGAAILLRRELFEQLGGFDSYYAPAYYEDTDLAMKVRQAGLRVLYQPKSVVVHYEGITSGTDTGSGVKAHQVTNQQKFLERWREVLATHPDPKNTTPTGITLARQHRAKRHVLVIDATTPQPDHDSGSVRLVNILRLLLEDGCAVTFFADNRAFVPGYSEALQQLGVEVLWHPHVDPPKWLTVNGARFDLVFVSRHYIASNYLELVRLHAPQAVFAFDTVDLHYLREQRAAKLEDRDDLRRTAAETRARELRLIRQSDVTLVVSHVEQELLAKDAPGARVEILSNVHEIAGAGKPFAERRDLVFVGGFQHPPNIDAATWFVREIFPLVRADAPDIRFHLIGSKATDAVKALGDVDGVEFHGFVPDIDPYMDGCRLCVAPLRYGAGVKGKVNLSMAHGQPVIATPIAVEGMFVEPGREVLVAETPADFARAVLDAYADEALWNQLAEGGIANVERHFGFDSARTALRGLFKR